MTEHTHNTSTPHHHDDHRAHHKGIFLTLFLFLKGRVHQIFRIALALGILFVVGYIFLPSLLFTKSKNAVVTANMITITAPIAGTVENEIPEIGTELKKGDFLTKILNPSADSANMALIRTEISGLFDRIEGLKGEMTKLSDLKEDLSKSFDHYKNTIIKNLSLQKEREHHKKSELENVLSGAEKDLARKEKLVKSGNISKADFDKSLVERDRSKEAMHQSESTLALLQQQIESLQNGIFSHPDGRSEVPYQLQRIHEITMKQSELKAQILELENRIQDKKAQLKDAEDRFHTMKERAVHMPQNGVILRKLVTKDSNVGEHHPMMDIIDCSHVYVDVTLNHGYFEKIRPGQKVKVKLVGANHSVEGTVVSMRGGAIAPGERTNNFVNAQAVDKNLDIQVFIQIEEKDLKQIKGDFCHVGRHATVLF